MSKLISGSDVLVHEATVCPLQETEQEESERQFGAAEPQDIRSMVKKIHAKGHSTAHEAAAFGRQVKAKNLILNHISNRYDFLDNQHYAEVINRMRELAAVVFLKRCDE